MITAIHGPLIYQPEQWVLVFDRRPARWWLGWLIPGKYKHVRAYGYVPFLHVWIFHDANLAGIEVWVAADGEPFRAMRAAWTAGDCDLMLMPRRQHASRSLFTAMSGWCVPHVKRLIGLRSSALRPSTLFADCLRNGGRLHELRRSSGPGANPGADLCAGSGPGAAARAPGTARAAAAAGPGAAGSPGTAPGLHSAAG